MTLPFTCTVQLGIPPIATLDSTHLELDDATRGKVGGSYTLADEWQWITISTDTTVVQIDRGRNRILDRCQPGTCDITVRNDRVNAGDYDPFNSSGPYFGYLGPRARIRVFIDFVQLFTGDIVDIDTQDIQKNVVTTTFHCVDPLARLNKTITWLPEDIHAADERLHRIIEVCSGISDDESFAAGIQSYQAEVVQTGTALDMVADVEFSEGGMLFCAGDGTYTFLEYNDLSASVVSPSITLTDAATGNKYSQVTRSMGWDLLYNTVTVTGLEDNSVPASVHDDPSANQYGEKPLAETLPLSTLLDRQYRAAQILDNYKAPQSRFDKVTIPMARYDSTVRAVLMCELGTLMTVVRHPPGSSTQTIDQVVVGISYTIVPKMITTTYTFAPQPN